MTEERDREKIGGYRVLRLLGKGGMGAVYEVVSQDGTHRAVKVFTLDHGDRDFLLKRFRAEAKLLTELGHPRIVKVYDAGVDAETYEPWFAMDLVLNSHGERETLEDVRKRGNVSQADALRWFRDLSDALNYTHSRGVVHRDVKLENVLIDADGHAVLSDFGISRIFDDSFRRKLNVETTFIQGQTAGTRPVMGTYFYLAPEVRLGKPVTPAADWYALGVLFFRLLTSMWYEPPSAQGDDGARRQSPFDLLLMYDEFWRANLPRLLSQDQKTRTVVETVRKAGAGNWLRRWILCSASTLAVIAVVVVRCWPASPKAPPGVLWVSCPEDMRGVDVGSVTAVVVKAELRCVRADQFKRWPNIRHLTIEEGVEEIGPAAFFCCAGLETVTLPDSLKHVGGYAFGDCFALREVRCGAGLVDVGQAAFGGCTDLMRVSFKGNAPKALGSHIYVRTPTNLVNHVKGGTSGWQGEWPVNDAHSRAVVSDAALSGASGI